MLLSTRRLMVVVQTLLVLLFIFCAFSVHGADSPQTVKVVLNRDYPPFSFCDESGKLQGFLVDLWRVWEKKTGLKAELHAMEWSEAQRRIDAGEFQVIDAIFYNESRSKKYDFSSPYYKVEVPAFFNGELTGVNTPASLRGFVVAVMAGDSVIEVLKRNNVTHLAEFSTYGSIVKAAEQGKVMVFAADKPQALYYLYKTGLYRKFKQTPPLYVGALHRAYPKGSHALQAKVERGFSYISHREVSDIEQKWFGSPPMVETPRFLTAAVAGVAGTLVLLTAWIFMLRRRVEQKTRALGREIEKSSRRADELRLSEESFRAIYDSVSEGIVIYDLHSRGILDVNRTMCDMFGLSREEAAGMSIGLLSSGVTPYTEQELDSWLSQAGEGAPQWCEWQSRARNGKMFWNEIQVRKAHIRQKDVLLITLRDISDRKQGEEALRRSEEKFREIVESAPVGIFRSTMQGRFFSVNPALATLFEFASPEEMVTSVTDIAEQLFVHPEQRRRLITNVLACKVFVQDEVAYRKKYGEVFTANLYLRAIRDEAGVAQFLEGFVEDVTERMRAYELTRTLNLELEQRVRERTVELEQANTALQQEVENRRKAQYEISCLNQGLMRQRAALEAANRELESFSYSVSHDLRAPLRHIHAFTEMLIKDCGSDFGEDGLSYLEKISRSVVKMQDLIDGLLSLSQVSRGELNTATLDLSVYAREIAQELQKTNPERRATFVIADQVTASADPVLIRSVLENLIGNSWKYSSKTESSLIEFGSIDQEGEQAYFVRDNGAGFNMAYADKLFGVFQRMHSSAEFEGCGIGLATVQRIIHRHGGRIWAQSEPGKGSTFYFTLKGPPSEISPEVPSP